MSLPTARSTRLLLRHYYLSSSSSAASPPVALQSTTSIAHHNSYTNIGRRSFSSSNSTTSSSGGNSTQVAFDRDLKKIQRNNAARAHQVWQQNSEDRVDYDYFREEIARRLVDRLDDIKRDEGFPLALDIGTYVCFSFLLSGVLGVTYICVSCAVLLTLANNNITICICHFAGAGCGTIHRAICSDEAINGVGGIGGVRKLVQFDSSNGMLFRDENLDFEGKELCDTYRMEGDEEEKLPFPDGTFDLVISSCAFHWVNNLPGLFKEAHVRYLLLLF